MVGYHRNIVSMLRGNSTSCLLRVEWGFNLYFINWLAVLLLAKACVCTIFPSGGVDANCYTQDTHH